MGEPNRQRLPGHERRMQLLLLAERVLLDGHAPELTMEGLAQQAGVAKTVVYSHFANAQDVRLAVLRRRWQMVDEQLSVLTGEGDTLDAVLAPFLDLYLGDLAEQRHQLKRLLHVLSLHPDTQAEIEQRTYYRQQHVVGLLQRFYGKSLSKPQIQSAAIAIDAGIQALGNSRYPSTRGRRSAIRRFLRYHEGGVLALAAHNL